MENGIDDQEFDQDNQMMMDIFSTREKSGKNSNGSLIKSQHIKWAGPTGAEAQVCHIEEEQLCFGLFQQRANCLMKILIEWMAIYEPSLLKYFDCALSTTVMTVGLDTSRHYMYRTKIEEQQARLQNRKQNGYFFNGEYKQFLMEDEDSKSENENESTDDDVYDMYSDKFDTAILQNVEIYRMYAASKQDDFILNDLKISQIQDDYQRKHCYAPLQIWPVYDTQSK